MGQRLSKAHNVKYFWNRLDNRHGQNCDWFICGFCRVAGGQIEVDQIFLACLGRGFFVRWKWTCKLFFGNLLSLFSMSAKKNKLKKSVSTLTSSLMQRGYFQWKKNKIRFKKWRKSIKASKEETLKLHVKRKKNWFKNFVRKSVSWITKKGLTEANLQLRTYLTILKDW